MIIILLKPNKKKTRKKGEGRIGLSSLVLLLSKTKEVKVKGKTVVRISKNK